MFNKGTETKIQLMRGDMAWIVAVDLCTMTLSTLKILANKISLLSSAANDHTGFITITIYIILQKAKIFMHNFYAYLRGIRLSIASFKEQTKNQKKSNTKTRIPTHQNSSNLESSTDK